MEHEKEIHNLGVFPHTPVPLTTRIYFMFSRVSVFTFFHFSLLLGGCRSMIVFLDLKKLLVGIKRQSMPGNILPIGWWCYATYHLPARKKILWLTKTQVWTPANVAVAPMQWFPTVMGALGWTSIIARRTVFVFLSPWICLVDDPLQSIRKVGQ